MKLNIDKIFDAMCDSVLHELSFKSILRQKNHKFLRPFLVLLQEDRKLRGLETLDFRMNPHGLKLDWNEWNSGGGCMIWSCDLVDGKSIHLSDESCFLADIPTAEYWELEYWEDQVVHQLAECDQNDHTQGRTVSFLFCPHVGQEMADLIAKDVDVICETL